MKTRLHYFALSFAIVVLLNFNTSAQLADGSIAPNWTLTDINGVSHTLYNYLDSGYAVILDVSATWCAPCWTYHNTHAMKDLYNQYGPPGTKKVMVFYIEGDESTTLADLQGTGSNTKGDWVTGTPYPIFNPTGSSLTSIKDSYNIAYFPTIYKICPNRILSEVGQKTTAQLYAETQQCPAPASTDKDPALLTYTGYTSTCSSVDLKVTLQNNGTSALTSAVLEAFDGTTSVATKNWTGNLSTYAIEEVTIGTVNITATSTFSLKITSSDNNSANNAITQEITYIDVTAPDMSISVEINTDQYGSETTWELIDASNGTKILNGGPYTDKSAKGSYAQTTMYKTLADGACYIFNIYDGYGDGMCCDFGNGYYKVIANSVEVISGAEFTSKESKSFKVYKVWPAGVHNPEMKVGVDVSPNPFSDKTSIGLSLPEQKDVIIAVYNMLGEVVYSKNMGSLNAGVHNITLEGKNLSRGLYYVHTISGSETVINKIILAK